MGAQIGWPCLGLVWGWDFSPLSPPPFLSPESQLAKTTALAISQMNGLKEATTCYIM